MKVEILLICFCTSVYQTLCQDTDIPVCRRSGADVKKLKEAEGPFDPFAKYQLCENWKGGNRTVCLTLREEICSSTFMCEFPTKCDLRCQRLDKVPSIYTCEDDKAILYEEFCDGMVNCDGGEDEIKSPDDDFNPFEEYQRCNNVKNSFNDSCLVQRDKICAREILCSNLTPCDLKCDNHYVCQNSNACLPRGTVCDSDSCDGCPEDHEWRTGHGFKCKRSGRECVLPQQLLHDDVPDCDGGVDICFGAVTALDKSSRNQWQSFDNLYRENCFLCLDDAMLILASRVCDGTIDCSDMSDECLCEEGAPDICEQIVTKPVETESTGISHFSASCDVGHVMCKSGKCIPRSAVCDGIRDCDEDESYGVCGGTMRCKDATGYEKVCRCERRPHSSSYEGTACDGVADCPIPLDEGWETSSPNTSPEDECSASCPATTFKCAPYIPQETKMTHHGAWCYIPPDMEKPLHYTRTVEKDEYCDGIVDCELSGSDEEESDLCSRFQCDALRPSYVSVREQQVCDGIIDCKDGSDEAQDMCGPKFACPMFGGRKYRVGLNMEYVCDHSINCDDNSDELNCKDGRFYCESGEPLFVRGHQVKDYRGDCSDWSDECPTINGSTQTNAFSSRYELISNIVLRIFVWFMGAAAIIGNLVVIVGEVKQLRAKDKPTSAIRANRLLILNLALADLLMGIYLMALAIMTLIMNGRYCSQDLAWRSSSTCVALGVITVISSETSVITMVLLTACRMYAVMKPFKSTSLPRKRHVCFMMAGAWGLSLLLAFLPLVPSLSHIFVREVEFENNPFSRNLATTLDGTKELFRKLVTFDLNPNVTLDSVTAELDGANWQNLKSASTKYFSHEHFTPLNQWGYYSAASVCIPKFFISRSDPAWFFSFVINLFNFLSFMFVALSYIFIYVKSKRDQSNAAGEYQGEDRRLKSMQRKIIRLIATDFCCWVPICMMAFCKLGGVEIGDTAYAVSAIILLPINSAWNPVLYSDFLDNITRKEFWKSSGKSSTSKSQSATPPTSARSTISTRVATNVVRGQDSPVFDHKIVDDTRI